MPPEHRGAEAQAEAKSRFRLPEGVVQVINSKSQLVHLYCTSRKAVACSAWEAGTPSNPARAAEFASSAVRWDAARHAVRFCINCHSFPAVTRLGGKVVVDGEEMDAAESSGTELSSSSSSS